MDFSRTYRLTDGTEPLRVSAPSGPEKVYVAGVDSFVTLPSQTYSQSVVVDYDDAVKGIVQDWAAPHAG